MIGDSRYLPLQDKSVNCVITSPPYWSLRKYDIPDLIWDGDEGCKHEWTDEVIFKVSSFEGFHKFEVDGHKNPDVPKRNKTVSQGQFCLLCSAWRGQLGLEPTIDLYLKHLMQIMDECKRVLRDDGTMWVNLGDSYSGSPSGNPVYKTWKTGGIKDASSNYASNLPKNYDVPAKSLCLIPYRFAIEMVNRGWILRNIIIWHKPNCMPSSVRDRFTVDFEPVFFFVKSKTYWFEQQYEDISEAYLERCKYPRNPVIKWDSDPKRHLASYLNKRTKLEPLSGRNRRCVWTIPTQPYPESHFATFPEKLIRPMIEAGCPKEICVKCGKARGAIYEGTSKEAFNIRVRDVKEGRIKHIDRIASQEEIENYQEGVSHTGEGRKLKGYTDCGCNAGFRPGIVLDPFCGSGTTMRVSERLNRVGIGIDLAYEDLVKKRKEWNQIELI